MSERVIVVGAGIAGLAAAHRLRRSGWEVTVLEGADHVGGRMSTVEREGYRLDTAAGFLGGKYRYLQELAGEAGLGAELVRTSDVFGFVDGGRIHTVRCSRLTDLARTPLLSPKAKASATKLLVDIVRVGNRLDYADLTRAADFDTESVLDYSRRRRLDDGLVHGFLDSVVRASLQNTLEQMSIIDLLFMLRNYLGASFMNFERGVGRLPEVLATQVGVTCSALVTSVEERPNSVTVTSTGPAGERVDEAAACVIALSAQPMAALHPGLDATQREIVAHLDYSKAITIHVALDRPTPGSAMYIQVPAREHPDLISIGVEHEKAPGRAPEGKGLLSTYWSAEWSAKRWDTPDEELVDDAVAALETVYPGLGGDVLSGHVFRTDPALLLSRAGTWASLGRFHRACAPGSRIRLAGDYFGGNSTNAAACSGLRAAAALNERFAR